MSCSGAQHEPARQREESVLSTSELDISAGSAIVFLGFDIKERGELKGFGIRDSRVASAFEQYFWELWIISDAGTTRPAE
jgi:hypothetical protein